MIFLLYARHEGMSQIFNYPLNKITVKVSEFNSNQRRIKCMTRVPGLMEHNIRHFNNGDLIFVAFSLTSLKMMNLCNYFNIVL